MKKLHETRKGTAFFNIGLSIVLSIVVGGILFGGLFSFLRKSSFFDSFIFSTFTFFLLFFAGFAASGVLLLFTKINEENAVSYGCGIYYGTILGGYGLQRFLDIGSSSAHVISFIIASLVCYILWQHEVKVKLEKKTSYEDAVLARQVAFVRTARCLNCMEFVGQKVNTNVVHEVFPIYGDTIPPFEHDCFEKCAVYGDIKIHIYVLRNVFELYDVRVSSNGDGPQMAFASKKDMEMVYQMVQSVLL